MPTINKKICSKCKRTVEGECPICKKEYAPKSWAGKQRHKLYGYRWQKAREIYLANNPLCQLCLEQGITKQAEHIHHKIKHEGDAARFWDVRTWQALCEQCHNRLSAQGL